MDQPGVDADVVCFSNEEAETIPLTVAVPYCDDVLETEIRASATGKELKQHALHLLGDRGVLEISLEDLRRCDAYAAPLQMGEYDIEDDDILTDCGVQEHARLTMNISVAAVNTLTLWEFDGTGQQGVSTSGQHLLKTSDSPDSNNVMVLGQVSEAAAFVEFRIHETYDECVIGVTTDPGVVAQVSGFQNIHMTDVWCYGKQGGHMGESIMYKHPGMTSATVVGFEAGDTVCVFVDPQQRQVLFYRNETLMVDNLAADFNSPLGEAEAYSIFAQVDARRDHIEITAAGVGRPYTREDAAKAAQKAE